MTTSERYRLPVTPAGMELSNLAPELWRQPQDKGSQSIPMQLEIRKAILDIEDQSLQRIRDVLLKDVILTSNFLVRDRIALRLSELQHHDV
jgi:hypothetical protein